MAPNASNIGNLKAVRRYNTPDSERILIAGSGGQGIVLIGRLLAGMALPHMAHITFFPAYGAEVRGGMSNCQLVFSNHAIASPVGGTFDSMILMNDACAKRFRKSLRSGGLLVYESDFCESLSIRDGIGVAATRISTELGDRRSANFIMLGAWMAARDLFPTDQLASEVAAIFAGKPYALQTGNIAAFEAGWRIGRAACPPEIDCQKKLLQNLRLGTAGEACRPPFDGKAPGSGTGRARAFATSEVAQASQKIKS